jgi:membrane-bound lytic murein transglycosylase A
MNSEIRMTKFAWLNRIGVMSLLLAACGCKPPAPPQPPPPQKIDYAAELPPGQLALRKLSPGEYPDFSAAILAFNVKDLSKAIDNSLVYLNAPSSKAFFPYEDIDHDRALATLRALKQVIETESNRAPLDGGRHFDATVKNTFEVYKSIGAPDPAGGRYTEQVLFTGYFTPIYNASLTRQGPYQFPLYKRPADLQLDANGEHATRKTPQGTQVPYYTRQQIEQEHALDGQELVWLANRFNAYVITVQGSARLRLPDGRIYEVGYNGNNGYDYTSPGRKMLADGVITKDQLTLHGLRNYFAAHPEAMDKYLSLNLRYIFFTERPGGPFGSLNVPVTTFATIATDKAVYPRAMPAFLAAPVPSPTDGATAFRGLMLDQDTGGGIRASGRCDIYMGVGESAERLAGEELDAGELYYLALKPELVPQHAVSTPGEIKQSSKTWSGPDPEHLAAPSPVKP